MIYKYLDTKPGIELVMEDGKDDKLTCKMISHPMGNDYSYQVWEMEIPWQKTEEIREFLEVEKRIVGGRNSIGRILVSHTKNASSNLVASTN